MKKNIKKFLPLAVLVVGAVQVVVPYILQQGFFNEESTLTLYAQPAGYVFAIWGLIYLFASLYTIYQVIPSNNNQILETNRIYALTLFVGSSLWLWASNFSLDWLWVTVPILALMAWSGYRLVATSLKTRSESLTRQAQFFSWQCLIIYTAWVNIAVFVNVGAMLIEYGSFTQSNLWTAINVLLLACVSLCVWIQFRSFKNSLWYGGVVVWALIGVFVANDGEGGSKMVMYLASVLTIPFIIFMLRKARDELSRYRIVRE